MASGRPRPLSETHFLFCQVGVMDLLRGCSKGHGAREAETWHLVTEQLAFSESWVPTQDGRLHGSLRWHKPWGKQEFPTLCSESFKITKF